jgi:mRNA interferase MazF
MNARRGEVWLADLNPIRGSEQSGTRPVIVMQNNAINRFTKTVLAIPLTTNLRRVSLPSCVRVPKGEGGLASDSVVLCHQMRVLDTSRLKQKLGVVTPTTIEAIEDCLLFTLGIT